MKTFKEIVKQLKTQTEEIELSVRVTWSVLSILLYIALCYIFDNPLIIGLIMALVIGFDQVTHSLWKVEDTKWFLIFQAWYVVLYTAITALFI